MCASWAVSLLLSCVFISWDEGNSKRTLSAPVLEQAHLLGQAEGDEVRQAHGREDDGEEGQGGRVRLEGPVVRHPHGLAQGPDEGLVGDGHGVGEEEEAQGDVEERERGDDRLCGYEGHVGVLLPGDSCVEKLGEAECEDGQTDRQTDKTASYSSSAQFSSAQLGSWEEDDNKKSRCVDSSESERRGHATSYPIRTQRLGCPALEA